MNRHPGCPPWIPVHTPNAGMLPGCRIRVKDRPSWGTGMVLDVADQSLVLVDFPGLGRSLKVGWAAVEAVSDVARDGIGVRSKTDDRDTAPS